MDPSSRWPTVVHAATAQDRFVQQGALRVVMCSTLSRLNPASFRRSRTIPPAAGSGDTAPYRDARWFPTQFHHRQKRVAQQRVDIDIRSFFMCAAPQTVQVSGRPLFRRINHAAPGLQHRFSRVTVHSSAKYWFSSRSGSAAGTEVRAPVEHHSAPH